jgi:hypothetical protein
LFLGGLTATQNAFGDTTSPMIIIILIELLLIAILYGGPYLINKIGTSTSQVIAAPIPLMVKHDTGLTTESPEIFIYHNTALNRNDDEKNANCPPEEKKRYSYAVSGWFWINSSATSKNADLTIFDFAGVPKLKYNPYSSNFTVTCNTIGGNGTINGGKPNTDTPIYRSIEFTKQTDEYKEFMMLNELNITTRIPLQKWNYFVINYDGKTMDIFLNNTLIGKSKFIMPNILHSQITSGDTNGLSGNICNVVFSGLPLTTEQIRWNYNTLKSLDPPMVGLQTAADEINNVGKTNVYSQ